MTPVAQRIFEALHAIERTATEHDVHRRVALAMLGGSTPAAEQHLGSAAFHLWADQHLGEWAHLALKARTEIRYGSLPEREDRFEEWALAHAEEWAYLTERAAVQTRESDEKMAAAAALIAGTPFFGVLSDPDGPVEIIDGTVCWKTADGG